MGEDDFDDFDAPMPSLGRLANIGHAFAIPWTHEPQLTCRGFESSRAMDKSGPWVDKIPFDDGALSASYLVYDSDGGSCTYRQATSSRSQSSSEHLSFGGSVSVGPDFLKAEVSGSYDKTINENHEGELSSRNASCRLGQVLLGSIPRYSAEARRTLRSANGQQKFRKLYGDYFIRGFTLGADAGVCVNAQFDKHQEKESLKVKVTVKLLFWSASAEHEETSEKIEVSAKLKVCGYSTLLAETDALGTETSSAADLAIIGRAASKYMQLVDKLESDARKCLAKLNLKDGAKMQPAQAIELCRSGLVVQLLLFPHALTQDYVESLSAGITSS